MRFIWLNLIFCVFGKSFFYFSEVSGFSYIGCYWNDDNNTLNGYNPPQQTTVQCFITCISANKGYTLAGTQSNPLGCLCGTTIYDRGLYSDEECNLPCPMTSSDLCGGKHRLAVFNITGETIPITISQGKETTTLPNTNESTEPPSCLCPCTFTSSKWDFLEKMNVTREELADLLKEEVEELQKNLTVDAKTTSLYKNSKRSASDRRVSSVLMGVVGGFVICIPIILVILFDIMRFSKNHSRAIRNSFL